MFCHGTPLFPIGTAFVETGMFRCLVAALLLLPSAAYGGQTTAQITVGMTIVPSASAQSAKTRPGARGAVATGRNLPFRERTVYEGQHQIRLIEF